MRQVLRVVLAPIALLLTWIGTVGLRLLLHRSDRTKFCGIPVASIARDHGTETAQLQSALELIRKHDPERLDRMRRDLEGILIGPLHGRQSRLRRRPVICEIDVEYARTASVPEVALAVVHEAEHARRLDSIRYDKLEPRLAEERRCLEAELAFARRLPRSGPLTKAIQDRFALLQQHYSDSAVYESERATLSGEGVPEWFIRLTDRERSPRGPGGAGAA